MTVGVHVPLPTLKLRFWQRFYLRRRGSYTVYGAHKAAKALLRILGKKGVRGSYRFLHKTEYYVLIPDNDINAIQLCYETLEEVTQQPIVIIYNDTSGFWPPSENVRAFSILETAATLFWSAYPAKPDEKIALIGGDPLLSILLRQALCKNIYSTSQSIQYHVWGNSPTTGMMMGLSQMKMDKIVFHSTLWWEDKEMLYGMDRIILCDHSSVNQEDVQELTSDPNCPRLYSYEEGKLSFNQGSESLVERIISRMEDGCSFRNAIVAAPSRLPKAEVTHFGSLEETLSRDLVLEEVLLQEVKLFQKQNLQEYGGRSWTELEPMEQQLLTAQVGYFPVLRRLFKAGIPTETLVELEHICRCRCHYLITYDIPTPPTFFSKKEVEPWLVPYPQLSDEERQKAKDAVKFAVSKLSGKENTI